MLNVYKFALIVTLVFSLHAMAYADTAPQPSPAVNAASTSTKSTTTTTAPTSAQTSTPAPASQSQDASKSPTAAKPSTTLVAKVLWVKGAFTALSTDLQSRTLNKDAPIYLHDTLITDANTQAQIVFTDNTLMTFRPNTKFYIDQYEFNSGGTTSVGKYIMRLIEGGFRTLTGLIAKGNPSGYQVNTPVATIGVRGTEYSVYYENGQLFVGYHHGSPCVKSLDPNKPTLCLDKVTPYAQVPNANSAPVPLTQQPAVLKQSMTLVPATYNPSNGTVTPSATINGFMSNFCIQ